LSVAKATLRALSEAADYVIGGAAPWGNAQRVPERVHNVASHNAVLGLKPAVLTGTPLFLTAQF
jgi:hypothetical protein